MHESSTTFIIKFIVGVSIWATTNMYFGAFAIAFISAFTRIVFEAECENSHLRCFKRLVRYFIMSFGLAMMFVHIGLWQQWNTDMTIVVSSIFAFMSEETMRFLTKNFFSSLVKVTDKVLK